MLSTQKCNVTDHGFALLHICDTYNCNYLPHTNIFLFYLIDLQISLSNFAFFNVKSPSNVSQRLVSQETAIKQNKNPSAFLCKTIGLG